MNGAAHQPERAEVEAVELVRVRLPLVRPFRSAHGVEVARELVLVSVTLGDGQVGWGECSALSRPTYSAEHVAGAWVVLRDEVVPAVLDGKRPDVVGHPMALAAMATALADARLRAVGRSLAVDLAAQVGGSPAEHVARTAVVGRGDSTDEVVAEVARRLADGVASVKLKATPAPDDLRAVAAVRSSWPDLHLAVDFNGSADRDALRAMDGLGLGYVEQPAPADELVRSAAFAASIDTPVALDESVWSAGSLDVAVALGAGAIVNVKPARCGGPGAAAALVARARNAGIDVFVGGMIECGVGRAAALAVAALPGCTLPTDLGPTAAYLDHDLVAPLRTDEAGRLRIPSGPGIGRLPDPVALAAATVDRSVLAR